MKFVFTDKKVEVSDALKDYAEKKLGKLDRYFRHDAEASVRFNIERGRHTAEVTVKHDGMFFRASESTGDMYASIDAAVGAIDHQINKNKTRLAKRLRQGAFEREAPAAGGDVLPDTGEDEDFSIIRTKQFPLKPMTSEEAILQMNLLGHEFFVFKNAANNSAYSVVYRRHDGGYGLIEEG